MYMYNIIILCKINIAHLVNKYIEIAKLDISLLFLVLLNLNNLIYTQKDV